ncbi:MAG: ribonuclease P protein component [Pseudomonadota bacterium]
MTPASFSFPRQNRLLSSKDFQQVFARSRRSRDALFMVCASYHNKRDSRLGLAISKRHARHAVQRNRIKRIAREYFRQRRDSLASADYVIVNQAAATDASNAELAESLHAHFRRLTSQRADRRQPSSKQ